MDPVAHMLSLWKSLQELDEGVSGETAAGWLYNPILHLIQLGELQKVDLPPEFVAACAAQGLDVTVQKEQVNG